MLSLSTPSSLNIASLSSSFSGMRLGQSKSVRMANAAGRGRLVAVRMGKREEQLKEIRGKSTEELQEEVIDMKGEIVMLRLQRSARKDFDQGAFRRMRKSIARMMTVKREREIEEGINKRLSRKMDKKWKRSIIPRPPPSLRKIIEERKAAQENSST